MNRHENPSGAMENNKSRVQEITEEAPPPFLKMYEVSGHEEIARYHLERYLKDKKDWEQKIREAARRLGNIRQASVNEQVELIRKALDHSSVEVREGAAETIKYLPESRRAELVKIVAEKINEDPDYFSIKKQREKEKMIRYAPENQRIKFICEELNCPSIKAQEIIKIISYYAFENERGKIIRYALNHSSIKVRKVAAGMIYFAPAKERAELFKLAVETLGDKLIESSLYDQYDQEEMSAFSRKAFAKTGSETTLIGGKLKGKVIIRHINPDAFLAWKDLYEDYELWQESGFDYVPIEPIVSYRLEKNGKVAVFSGVLDLNSAEWQGMTSRFTNELEAIKDKILAVLRKKNIRHGHPEDVNFCLRFWRDKNGRPDMNRTPRLYLIDFDRAVSP